MKKRILIFIAALFMILSCALPAFAETTKQDETTGVVRLYDGAELLTESERDSLLVYLDSLSEENEFDIAIITTSKRGAVTIEKYAENCYHSRGYGENGILLVIDMSDRSYYEFTHGLANEIWYSDYIFERLEDDFLSELSEGNYNQAFTNFATSVDDFIKDFNENSGTSETEPKIIINGYDRDYWYLDKNGNIHYRGEYDDNSGVHIVNKQGNLYYQYQNAGTAERVLIKTELFLPKAIIFGLIVALIIALVMTYNEKSKLTSVAFQKSAGMYVIRDSFRLNVQRDVYLYKTVSRVRINTNNNRPGGNHMGGSHMGGHMGGGHMGGSHGGHGGHMGGSHGGHGGHF